jgi:DNA-binding winged helix-turn-helix (wHTH) protein
MTSTFARRAGQTDEPRAPGIVYQFAEFSFEPFERLLRGPNGGVRLGSRGCALLTCLLDHAGMTVRTADLIGAAWPNEVENVNLRVHIAALRRALGETRASPRFIQNVPGSGYRFASTVHGHRARVPVGHLEAQVASRLAAFAHGFTLDAALSVTSDVLPNGVEQVLRRMMQQGLLIVRSDEPPRRYDLALGLRSQLAVNEAGLRAHANYLLSTLSVAFADWEQGPTSSETIARWADDVGLVLTRANEGEIPRETAAELLAVALPMAIRIGRESSLMEAARILAGTTDSDRLKDVLAIVGSRSTSPAAAHRISTAERLFEMGQFEQARAVAAESLRAGVSAPLLLEDPGVDERVRLCSVLARSLWILGYTDRALVIARQALSRAEGMGPHDIAFALTQAVCPLHLWRGEDLQASKQVRRLRQLLEQYDLQGWRSWLEGLEWSLHQRAVRDGRASPALALPPPSEEHSEWIATFTGIAGFAIPANPAPWCRAEIGRLRALHSYTASDDPSARRELLRAIETAQAQGAVAWELRATVSLARLPAGDRAPLLKVLPCLREGKGTTDVILAQSTSRHAIGS